MKKHASSFIQLFKIRHVINKRNTFLFFNLVFLIAASFYPAYAAGVNLKWDHNNDADYYVVYYGKASGSYTETSKNINAPATEITLSGLEATTWYFAVKAFNQCGNSSDYSDEITYTPSSPSPLHAAITSPATNTTIDKGGFVDFQGTISGGLPPYTILWDFGTSGIPDSTDEDPGNRQFNTDGTFAITLTVTDSNNDVSISSVTITVNPVVPDTVPVATIVNPSSDITIFEGKSVFFQSTVTGGNGTPGYRWDFGINGPAGSSIQNPGNVTFLSAGTYTVTFTATDQDGDSSSDTVTVTVEKQITDTFPSVSIDNMPTNTTINEGESVNFYGSVSDGNAPFTHIWDFGNNGPSDENVEDPGAVIFPSSGTYTVTYTVIDTDGDTDSATVTVTVNKVIVDTNPVAAIVKPTADITIKEGEQLYFEGGVTGGNAQFTHAWNFGAGGPSGSSGQVPGNVTFSNAGSYKVTYTVTDSDGDTSSAIRTVSVEKQVIDTNPVAAIEPLADTTIIEGAPVGFYGTLTGGNAPFVYSWTFGSGGPVAISVEDPGDVVFQSAGTYYVVFTVTDADNDTSSDTITVVVKEKIPDTNPVAVIALPSSNITTTTGEPVTFNGTVVSGNAPYNHSWDFGTGDLPGFLVEDPGDVTFSKPGTYTATYTVTDSDNDTSSAAVIITVVERIPDTKPVATIGTPSTDIVVIKGKAIEFTGSVSGGNEPITHAWDFGAAGPSDSNLKNPGYITFPTTGTFTVTYTVTDADNDISYDRTTVTVSEIPVNSVPDAVIASPGGDVVIEEGGKVSFTGEVSGGDGALTYSWDFGSGGPVSGSDKDPGSVTFTDAGTYTVIFTVTDQDNETGSDSVVVIVNQPDTTEPVQPEPVYPSQDEGVSLTPELVVDVGNEGVGTRWQISTDLWFNSIILDIFKTTDISTLKVPRLILNRNTTYYWRARQTTSRNMESEWSVSTTFTTITENTEDHNNDGIPDNQETGDDVDLNHDGVADSMQDMISCIRTIVGDTTIGIMKVDNVVDINVMESINHMSVEDKVNMPDIMPLGLIAFRVTVENPGDTARIRVCLNEAAPENAGWYKYDSVGGWMNYSSYSSFSSDRKMIDVTLTDGGIGDADGTANGVIVDPAGLGLMNGSSTVPSLTIGGAEAAGQCFIGSTGETTGMLQGDIVQMLLCFFVCLLAIRVFRRAFPK